MKVIAHIKNDYDEKFGIPRQSGIVDEDESFIVFEKEYAVPEAFRGLEEFSHIWIIWQFSQTEEKEWSPTVRPPKLGGNIRKGVFATRSPFRPNPVGLSCVKLTGVYPNAKDGAILRVSGADLMNGTPVYDIKPYLPYADSVPEASNGFADTEKTGEYEVVIPDSLAEKMPREKLGALKSILSLDPRPQYKPGDDGKVYGMKYAGRNIKFTVSGKTITVENIE